MVETICCVVAVLAFTWLAAYLCNTSDRRIDLIEREKLKRERDIGRWI